MQMQPSKSYRAEFFKTLTLATPIMFNQLSHVMVQATDSIMVGHLGAVPLAASGFASAVFGFFMIYIFGFSSVLSSVVANSMGEKKPEDVSSHLWHGILVNGAVALVTSAAMLALLPHLDWFRQTPEVTLAAYDYIFYLSMSLFPLGLYMVYSRFCEGVSDSVAVTVVSWLGVACNILLNWFFIFGIGTIKPMGLAGAGLATFLTRVILLIVLATYVHTAKRYQKFNLNFSSQTLIWEKVKKIFRLGVPASLMMLNEVAAFAFGGIMMGWVSTEALAAHLIALNIASATFILGMGWSFATTVRIGEAHGKNDIQELQRVAMSSFFAMLLLMSITALLFVVFRHQLPLIYSADQNVVALAAQLLIIAGIFQIFDGTQCLGIAMNKGVLDVRVPFYITCFSYWFLSIPFGYYFTFKLGMGPKGIWYGYLLSLFAASLLLNGRFFSTLRVRFLRLHL